MTSAWKRGGGIACGSRAGRRARLLAGGGGSGAASRQSSCARVVYRLSLSPESFCARALRLHTRMPAVFGVCRFAFVVSFRLSFRFFARPHAKRKQKITFLQNNQPQRYSCIRNLLPMFMYADATVHDQGLHSLHHGLRTDAHKHDHFTMHFTKHLPSRKN